MEVFDPPSLDLQKKCQEKNHALLLEKFPLLAFCRSFSSSNFFFFLTKKGELSARRKKGGKEEILDSLSELFRFKASWPFSLEETEVLYICGLGLGYAYKALKEWLEGKKERRLVFVEEEEYLGIFLRSPFAEELLCHPQVHLFLYDQKEEGFLEEMAKTFPVSSVEVVLLPNLSLKRKKRFRLLREKILKKTLSYYSLRQDFFYSHGLFHHFLQNLSQWESSFFANRLQGAFEAVPAIICGAGPSLSQAEESLKKSRDRALIFGGGSAIAALSYLGVFPHIAVAVDPNEEEFRHLKENVAFEIPFIYSTRVQPKIFQTFNGLLLYLSSGIGLGEFWLEDRLGIKTPCFTEGLKEDSASVTLLSLALARFLGCNPIFLCGVDLAYTDHLRYAKGVVKEDEVNASKGGMEVAVERVFQKKGHPTHLRWTLEAECIAHYAASFPKTTFIDVTEGGIGFPNIRYLSLEKALKRYCQKTWNVSSWLYSEIQKARFPEVSLEKKQEVLRDLKASFERAFSYGKLLLSEIEKASSKASVFPTGKMVLFETELQEEEAWKFFLAQVMNLFEKEALLHSQRRSSQQNREFLIEKWQGFCLLVERYLCYFSRN